MLVAEALTKYYQSRKALNDFSYDFKPGLIYGVIGPNGAGKSTLLRLLSAWEKPISGKVYYQGQLLRQPVPEISCVWQKPYLFQNAVHENIAYGLKVRRWRPAERRWRVNELLELFQLGPLANQWAPSLSVGESARVAIARAVAPRPKLLLLDEPAANLDPANTRLVEQILGAYRQTEEITIILVTHDMFQAKRLADIILFMADGQLVEAGTRERIFQAPVLENTRRFINGELLVYETTDAG